MTSDFMESSPTISKVAPSGMPTSSFEDFEDMKEKEQSSYFDEDYTEEDYLDNYRELHEEDYNEEIKEAVQEQEDQDLVKLDVASPTMDKPIRLWNVSNKKPSQFDLATDSSDHDSASEIEAQNDKNVNKPIRIWRVNPVKVNLPKVTKPTLPTPPPTPEVMGKISQNFMPTTKPKITSAADKKAMIKQMLRSGKHGNDPAKIKAMVDKLYQKKDETDQEISESEEDAAKSIFEKYANGKKNTFETKKWVPSSARQKDKDKDKGENKPTSEIAKDNPFKGIRPWKGGLGTSYGSRGGGASSAYHKFAQKNIGSSIRRPRPPADDEESKIAKGIYEKYSRNKSKPTYAKPATPQTTTAPTTVATSASEQDPKSRYTKPQRKYTKKPAGYYPGRRKEVENKTRSSNSGFWPTPKPFKPVTAYTPTTGKVTQNLITNMYNDTF